MSELRRKITTALARWKDDKGHNPLIIKGCRQCGKTFSVLDFAKSNYTNVVYLNFFENPKYASIFEGSLATSDIIMYISALTGGKAKFEEGKTCIVLDELQECPDAIASLKFFKMDGRFDVICTGSLLGIQGYKGDIRSVPVGYVTQFNMFPLDFEEFLWARGISEELIGVLEEHLVSEKPIPQALHLQFQQLLKEYVIVGGMPGVVNEYLRSRDLSKVLKIQRDIVSGYKEDMIKYASGRDKAQIRECFDSIPKQLAKENKKFQYSLVRKGGRAANFSGCIQWIEDADIIRRCYNLNITELPLDGNAQKDTFKLYMSDIGLLVSMLEDGTQFDILNGSMLMYKGAIYENLIADIFGKMERKLYYFHKDSGLEIDFVIRYKGYCTLIEVKANTGNAKSMSTIMNHPEKYHVEKAIKLGQYNIGRSGNTLILPLYLAFLLREV